MRVEDYMILICGFILCIILCGCMTNNYNLVCGERNNIKASDNDTPKTTTDLKIPLLK